MKKYIAYIFTGIGLAGSYILLNYPGIQIPVKELWLVLSVFLFLSGLFLFARYKLGELNKPLVESPVRLGAIKDLMLTGEKVRVTLENAEIKTRSYYKEVLLEGFPSRVKILDSLYDDNRNYKTQYVVQTYIVFTKQFNTKTYKFISQPTTQTKESVKLYLENEMGIDLYIDTTNPENYYFDWPAS
ncbi:MAG TPA: hypothetical protein VHK91_12800 [Flavisolibacter sp.]|jgi:hypothetical protein|nr:hypothetical protein [Flavisolibacter sp.]